GGLLDVKLGGEAAFINIAPESVRGRSTMFNVVLIEPEIPPNTGNVGRLCLATQSTLHLVKPLGFSLEDRQLKRAGLDYWDDVDLSVWDSLPALIEAKQPGEHYFFVMTKTNRANWYVQFR